MITGALYPDVAELLDGQTDRERRSRALARALDAIQDQGELRRSTDSSIITVVVRTRNRGMLTLPLPPLDRELRLDRSAAIAVMKSEIYRQLQRLETEILEDIAA